jgi:predicted lipoprotein with Yx(FWY)xxD motif
MSARSTLRRLALVSALVAGGAAVATVPLGAAQPTLQAATIARHPHVLIDAAGHPLYILTSEAGGKIKCVTSCTHVWPPVMLPVNVGTFSRSAAVKGSLAWVKRGKFRQATFNGYPLYTFAGDTKPHEAKGVGLKLGAGTWVLVNAWAKTAAATPEKVGKITTTSSSSSGGGW